MHSEKLKELVEKKTPLKFRIKDDKQAKELQEFLFALGIRWTDGDCDLPVTLPDVEYIYLGEEEHDPYEISYTKAAFQKKYLIVIRDYPIQEFDLENDCLVGEEKIKEPDPRFTQEQKDFICYQIGEWYMKWKDGLIDFKNKTHLLGFAKEELKTMVCDEILSPDEMQARDFLFKLIK